MNEELPKQRKIKSNTITSYLTDFRIYHVNRGIFIEMFEQSSLNLLIKEEKRMFVRTKRRRLSIMKSILEKITDDITDQITEITD